MVQVQRLDGRGLGATLGKGGLAGICFVKAESSAGCPRPGPHCQASPTSLPLSHDHHPTPPRAMWLLASKQNQATSDIGCLV